MKPYPRPTPTQSEQEAILRLVDRVLKQNRPNLTITLTRLLIENASLTAECNAHRAALGYNPLPTYHPDGKEPNEQTNQPA